MAAPKRVFRFKHGWIPVNPAAEAATKRRDSRITELAALKPEAATIQFKRQGGKRGHLVTPYTHDHTPGAAEDAPLVQLGKGVWVPGVGGKAARKVSGRILRPEADARRAAGQHGIVQGDHPKPRSSPSIATDAGKRARANSHASQVKRTAGATFLADAVSRHAAGK